MTAGRNAPVPEHAGPAHPGTAWGWRYGCIFAGQALSLLGSAVTQFVLLWWITDTTGSVQALATAGLAALLPQAVLSPLGGVLADRWSRRALMIAADAVSAACMLAMMALLASGEAQLWHAYTILAVRSAMQAFQMPAAEASVAMLVPAGFLPRAAGMNQTLVSLSLVGAAPLGALALGTVPLAWALGIDVATALLGIVPLLIYRIPQPGHEEGAGTGARAGVWSDFRAGLRFVWRDPGLRRLYLLLGALMVAVMPAFTLAPLLVKEHFAGGPPEVAWMEALAGVGMVAGGMLAAVLAPRRQVPWVLGGLAVSCLALALTGLAPQRLFAVAVAWWTVSGAAFALGNAPLVALLQTVIPHGMQGRALALLNALMGLAAPLGLMAAAPLGEAIGVRWLFVVVGLLGAGVGLLGFASPALRALDRRGTAPYGGAACGAAAPGPSAPRAHAGQ